MFRIIKDIIRLIKDAIMFIIKIGVKLLIVAAIIAIIVYAVKNALPFLK